ncbi:hypothetical protein AVEN_156902-1 [Araneus ventricosus]|uniref:ribonuclease H n=1 Tax=Araneus ventricosus TaxID=182803 RepID=A0A4Y2ENY9_ARAVE|nr:hypothetical protein AVEN_156902-1 [Araneus ventricosus]
MIKIQSEITRFCRATWGVKSEITKEIYLRVTEELILYGLKAWYKATVYINKKLLQIYRYSYLFVSFDIQCSMGKIMIDWYFKDQIEKDKYNVFTDGSKCNGRVGFGIVIYYEDRIQREYFWRLNDEATVFLAVSQGIKNAIMETLDLQGEINIYTDSRSGLQSLNSPWSQCEIIHEIKKWIQNKIKYRLYWIKVQIGVAENEKADSFVKTATEKDESIMVISM